MKGIKNSTPIRSQYKKICEELGERYYEPVLDCETRWNSTYSMLCRALQMQKVIEIPFN